MDSDDGKIGTVKSITELVVGAKINLTDFQVTSTDNFGKVTMIDIELEPSKESNAEYRIQEGNWRVTPSEGLHPMGFVDETYFETQTSRELTKHFDVFRKKLDLMKKKGKTKRGVLLGSEPGSGKSALIRSFIRKIKEMPRLCVLRIDSPDVSYEKVTSMFMNSDPSLVDFIVLVIEDLGGSNLNDSRKRVDADCLNFLDGNINCFKIPTLIIATTNFLDELGSTLTDRPGRFDVVLQVEPPSDEESLFLVENYLGRELLVSEINAIKGNEFTPAYCIEIVDRVELYDISMEESVSQLKKQREKSRALAHTKPKEASVGFFSDDDDF